MPVSIACLCVTSSCPMSLLASTAATLQPSARAASHAAETTSSSPCAQTQITRRASPQATSEAAKPATTNCHDTSTQSNLKFDQFETHPPCKDLDLPWAPITCCSKDDCGNLLQHQSDQGKTDLESLHNLKHATDTQAVDIPHLSRLQALTSSYHQWPRSY